MSKRGLVAVKHSGHRVEVDRPNTGRQHARCVACGLEMNWRRREPWWIGPLLDAEVCTPGADVETVIGLLAPDGIAIFEEEPSEAEVRAVAEKIVTALAAFR
jgi:hypothetical protein